MKLDRPTAQTGRAFSIAIGGLFLGMLPFVSIATAEPSEKISLRFDVISRNTTVYDIGIDFQLSPTRYTAEATAGTTGVIGFFVDEQMTMSAQGALADATARPAHFIYNEKSGKELGSAKLSWSDARIDVDRSFKIDEDRAQDLDDVVTPALADPLSAVLSATLTASDSPCSGSHRVYNGREVFDLAFSHLGKTTFEGDDGGVYRGPVHKCEVQYLPVAGLSKKKMKRYSANPPTYTIWFAEVPVPALGRDILLPVAARGKIKDTDVKIIARTASIDGRPLNSQSLVSR
ncbi:hypothetical protein FHS85_000034 [Rhodoligotrophos appendicifer]|uniref:DUF3108 domain-containing protein n=1 Tax=Rhodoligotrophos appendicifer TaxID=987056 RepID=UPI00117F19B7|nr:DUF3108 domain-containing protein [Rhodoligotrophos appendicifer]